MPSIFIAIGCWIILILLAESIMWALFKRKFAQICLPTEADKTIFHFFTVGRMRIVALLHTLVLIVAIIFGHLLLWP